MLQVCRHSVGRTWFDMATRIVSRKRKCQDDPQRFSVQALLNHKILNEAYTLTTTLDQEPAGSGNVLSTVAQRTAQRRPTRHIRVLMSPDRDPPLDSARPHAAPDAEQSRRKRTESVGRC